MKKPKVEKDFKETMQHAGFRVATAKKQEDFWKRHGIKEIQIGNTLLKVKGAK